MIKAYSSFLACEPLNGDALDLSDSDFSLVLEKGVTDLQPGEFPADTQEGVLRASTWMRDVASRKFVDLAVASIDKFVSVLQQ